MSTLVMILLGALVVFRVLGRQLVGSAVTGRSLVLMPAILVVVGLGSAGTVLSTASPADLGFFAVDLLIVLVLGVARGASTTLSLRDGGLYQRGGVVTLILWLATIGLRVGAGFLSHGMGIDATLTTATMLLTFGLTIAAQNATIFWRAQQLRLPLAVAAPRR